MAKVAKKLKDAEAHFRESGGSRETIVLRSVVSPHPILSSTVAILNETLTNPYLVQEAISLYHAEASTYCRLKHTEKNVTILQGTLKNRNETIENLIRLNITFQKKVEDLMGFVLLSFCYTDFCELQQSTTSPRLASYDAILIMRVG